MLYTLPAGVIKYVILRLSFTRLNGPLALFLLAGGGGGGGLRRDFGGGGFGAEVVFIANLGGRGGGIFLYIASTQFNLF